MAHEAIGTIADDTLLSRDAQRAREKVAEHLVGPDAQRDAEQHHHDAAPGDDRSISHTADAERIEQR